MATRQRSRRSPARKAPVRPASQRTQEAVVARATGRRVLVATDASKASTAAIRFARSMEDSGAWIPEALTVIEHLPVAVADVMLPTPIAVMEPVLMEGPLSEVRRQLQRYGASAWPFRSELGAAPALITEYAKLHASEVIVLGLGRHGKLARLFGAETAARVCRHSDIPVLAVDEHARHRPRSIVVAMDFGASSVRAAHEALDLLPPGGRLHLVHVRWALEGHTLRDEAWERTYAMGVEQGFLRLERELARPGITVTTELKLGAVLESILKVAKERDADVIALGSHSQNIVDRMLLGSTPAALLRAAKCSILVAPARGG